MDSRKVRISTEQGSHHGMDSRKVRISTEQGSYHGMDSRKVRILQSREVRGMDSRN